MEQKTTLILGASTNPARYAFKAAQRLSDAGHPIINIGLDEGLLFGVPIQKAREVIPDVHTITLYINPRVQKEYYQYILDTKPQRLIFNPGTENTELKALAKAAGIEPLEACTLVLLSLGAY